MSSISVLLVTQTSSYINQPSYTVAEFWFFSSPISRIKFLCLFKSRRFTTYPKQGRWWLGRLTAAAGMLSASQDTKIRGDLKNSTSEVYTTMDSHMLSCEVELPEVSTSYNLLREKL